MSRFRAGSKFLPIILALFIAGHAFADSPSSEMREVSGTALADLNNAYEVLQRLPSLMEMRNSFYIIGQGLAEIYVNGKHLANHSDLLIMPASTVKSVEILTEARPEYGNRSGIILITLMEPDKDKFNLSDVLQMVAAPMVSGKNDLNVSGRKNSFLYDAGLLVNYLATKDLEKRYENLYTAMPGSSKFVLGTRRVADFYDVNRDYGMNLKANFGYIINDHNELRAGYDFEYDRLETDWDGLKLTFFQRRGSKMDLDVPTAVIDAESVSMNHVQRHSLNLGYKGDCNGWDIAANLDMYFGFENQDDTDHETNKERECVMRQQDRFRYGQSFLKANCSHRLWKGDVRFGISVDDYSQTSLCDDTMLDNDRVHARFYCAVPGAFVSFQQELGRVELDLGLNYQAMLYRYNPYDDDQTQDRIKAALGTSRIKFNEHRLNPALDVKVPAGDAMFFFGAQSTTDFPPVSALRLWVDHLRKNDFSEALVRPGRQNEAFVKGEWKWLEFRGWGTYNDRPVFQNVDYEDDFNGPDYWSMDWRLTLSPSVGIWNCGLTAELHKQWLKMGVVDPVDNLSTPIGMFRWMNSFSFPWKMRLELNGEFRTRGAQMNMYFREPTWNLDLVLQQSFLKDHLVLSLTVNNLAHMKRDSIAFYTRKAEAEFDFNSRLLNRMMTISLRYTL